MQSVLVTFCVSTNKFTVDDESLCFCNTWPLCVMRRRNTQVTSRNVFITRLTLDQTTCACLVDRPQGSKAMTLLSREGAICDGGLHATHRTCVDSDGFKSPFLFIINQLPSCANVCLMTFWIRAAVDEMPPSSLIRANLDIDPAVIHKLRVTTFSSVSRFCRCCHCSKTSCRMTRLRDLFSTNWSGLVWFQISLIPD